MLDRPDHPPGVVARAPAHEARNRVARQHRLAVVELEARAQAERPDEAVGRHLLGLDHLPLRLQLHVEAVEHVVDEGAGVAHDGGGAPGRVEIGEIRVRHEAQGARAARQRRRGEPAGRGQRRRARGGLEELASVHGALAPWQRPRRSVELRTWPRPAPCSNCGTAGAELSHAPTMTRPAHVR